MRRTRLAGSTIKDIKERIKNTEKKRETYSNYLKKLQSGYSNGKISYSKYVETIYQKRHGRNIQEWIDCLDKYDRDYRRELKREERKNAVKKTSIVFFSLAILGFLVFLFFSNFKPSFAGFAVKGNELEFSQKINLEFSQSQNYELPIQNKGKLSSLKLSGNIEGIGTAKVYLNDLLIYSGEINSEEALQTKEKSSPSQGELLPSEIITKNFTDVCEQTCDLEKLNLIDSAYTLKIELSENMKLNLEELKYTIIPETPENISETPQPSPETNVTTPTIPEINITTETNVTTEENVTLPAIPETNITTGINQTTENTTATNITAPEITGNITGTNVTILTEENATIITEQYQAVLNQKVKWKKRISPESTGNLTITLPKEAENIIVTEITPEQNKQTISPISITGATISANQKGFFARLFERIFGITGRAIQEEQSQPKEIKVDLEIDNIQSEYQVEYETPAPYAIEQETERGKEVKIVGLESIHYENVLSFTNLDEKLNIKNPSRVKIYWRENGSFVPVQKIEDRNNNEIYDYVEWVVPSLSNQTFDIIIEISKAEHLDSNKQFISDIYEQVKALDDIWSELINNNEYVRVTFEQTLDSSKDITLYPRVISGTPKIEVYEKDETTKIAEFTNIVSNEYNKVYLTNLQNSQDTFDLRVVGGSLQLDYIIDPSTLRTYYLQKTASAGQRVFNTTSTGTVRNESITSRNTSGTTGGFNWTANFSYGSPVNLIARPIITTIIYCRAVRYSSAAIMNISKVELYDCGASATCATGTVIATNMSIAAANNGGNCNSTTAANFLTVTLNITNNYTMAAGNRLGIGVYYLVRNATMNFTYGSTNYQTRFNVTEDNLINPDVNILFPSNKSNWSVNTINVNYTAIDSNGISACWFSNNSGQSNNTLAGCANITGRTWLQGFNNITVWANDTYNNRNSSSVTFFIDSNAPNITILYPSNNTNTTNTQINVNYTASDNNGVGVQACWYSNTSGVVNYSLNGCSNITGKTWLQGINNVTIWANDTFGNRNSSSVRFTIDNIPPNVTINSPLNRTYGNTNITFNISAIDSNVAVSGCWYSLTNGTINYSMQYPNLINLSNGFSTSAADAFGPRGIVTNNSDFWMLDISGFVYHFNRTGGNISDRFSTLTFGADGPSGLARNDSDFWITDLTDFFVYHVNKTGLNFTNGFSTLALGSTSPRAITTNGSDFWIADWGDAFVYHTNRTGGNISDGFSTSAFGSGVPYGITTNKSDFWIADYDDRFVYHTNRTGGNISDGFSTLPFGANDPYSITTNVSLIGGTPTDFWFNDIVDKWVYHLSYEYYWIAINSTMSQGAKKVNYYCNDTLGNLNYSEGVSFNINNVPNVTNIAWMTVGGSTSNNLTFGTIIAYFNATVNDAPQDAFSVNITLTDPDNIKVIDKGKMSNSTYSFWNYSTPVTLEKAGNWTVNITAFDGANSVSNLSIITINIVKQSTREGWYGYTYGNVSSAGEINDLINYNFELLELSENYTRMMAQWTAIKNATNNSFAVNVRTGLNILWDYNYSIPSEEGNATYNISQKFPELLLDPYSITMEYISIDLFNRSGYSYSQLVNTTTNLAEAILMATNNKFPIYVKTYNLSGIYSAYVRYTPLLYVTGFNQSLLMTKEIQLIRTNQSLNRIYYNLTAATKTVAMNTHLVYSTLRSALNITSLSETNAVSLNNLDVLVFNNFSTAQNFTMALSEIPITGKDVWDHENKYIIETNTDNNFNVSVSPYSITVVYIDDLDHMTINGLTSTTYKQSVPFTGDMNYSVGQALSPPTSSWNLDSNNDILTELFDPHYYIKTNFITYYGWLNESISHVNFKEMCDNSIIIIADKNNTGVDQLTANCTNATEIYGYVSVFDYTNSQQWYDNKTADVNNWTILNESMNLFIDGIDVGVAGPNFSSRMKDLVDYVQIQKGKKAILNTYTAYQNFSTWGNGGVMRESCVNRWNGASSLVPDNYSRESWSLELNKSIWLHSHNIRVICQAFNNRTSDGSNIIYNYTDLQDIYFASKVLGYDYFYLSQPDFSYAFTEYVYDVGNDLSSAPLTNDNETYYRLYSQGIIYYNKTSQHGWIDDGRVIQNSQVCFNLYDANSTNNVTFNFNINRQGTTDTGDYWFNDSNFSAKFTWENKCVNISNPPINGRYLLEAWITPRSTIAGQGLSIGWTQHVNYSVYSYYDSSLVDSWSKYPTGQNWQASISLTDTKRASIDTTLNINQTDTFNPTNTTVNISSNYPFNISIYSDIISVDSTFTNITYNGNLLNISDTSDCDTAEPTFANTTIDGLIHGACRKLIGDNYSVRIKAPSLSERFYTIFAPEGAPPNNPPEITSVYNQTLLSITLNPGPAPTGIIINFTAYDLDGDLNDSTAKINISMANEQTRENGTCIRYQSSTYYSNYTCNVTMWWFDGAGTWNITASILDNTTLFAQNNSAVFQIGLTTGFEISPSVLNWPVFMPGSRNQTSSNDPIIVNNTGNQQFGNGTGGTSNISINATNLIGEINSAFRLWANNFSVSTVTGGVCTNGACVECNGNTGNLSRGLYVNVSNSTLPKGNYTKEDGTGQEQLYFCLRIIGNEISGQPYSTLQEGTWTIKMLLVAFIPARKKRKKTKLQDDKLLDALNIIADELKKEYSLNKEELLQVIIGKLKDRYDVEEKEILDIIKSEKETTIPITIFSKELGGLEAISKYMKENLNMNYSEIAKELHRNERTIWTSYKKAKEKQEEIFTENKEAILIPVSIFKDNGLTIFESIISYLRGKEIKYSEIAKLLNRDQRNIRTIYIRTINKKKRNV